MISPLRTSRIFVLFFFSVLQSFTEDVAVLLIEAFKVAALEGLADLTGEAVVEVEVV